MRWHSKSIDKENSTFLLLPPVIEPRSVSATDMAPSSPASSTGTWPPKRYKAPSRIKIPPPATDRSERPATATLERPNLLDIGLLNKLDMSLVRKEFLCITNLCRLPLHARRIRPTTLTIKKHSNSETNEIQKDEEKNTCSRSNKLTKINKKDQMKQKNASTSNGVKTLKNNVTPPCTTCGRPEQPERFHSHPVPAKKTQSVSKLLETPTQRPMKSTVQKPVAIRFKSKRRTETPTKTCVTKPRTLTCYICAREFGTASLPLHEPKCLQRWERENAELPRHLRRKAPVRPEAGTGDEDWNRLAWQASQASLAPCQNCGRTFLPDRLIVHAKSCRPRPQEMARSSQPPAQEIPRSNASSPGPPVVRCYICGRLFGTKSIAIHEPQCLKKWKMQNDLLPPGERLPTPRRSAQITPLPEPVQPENVVQTEEETQKEAGTSGKMPCYICGKEFSVPAIYNHETVCLKKWREENDRLPPEKRRPEPNRPDVKFTASGSVDYVGTFHRIWENHLAELVPCRICGRRFFPDRIEIHEKACNNLPIKKKKQ